MNLRGMVILLLAGTPLLGAEPVCTDKDGVNVVPCVDKAPVAKPKTKTTKKVITFKPATTHGQILSPGEKPPTTTIEESKKELAPVSSGTAKSVPHP